MSKPRYYARFSDGKEVTHRSKTPLTHAWYANTERGGVLQEKTGFAVSGEAAYQAADSWLGNRLGRREVVRAQRSRSEAGDYYEHI